MPRNLLYLPTEIYCRVKIKEQKGLLIPGKIAFRKLYTRARVAVCQFSHSFTHKLYSHIHSGQCYPVPGTARMLEMLMVNEVNRIAHGIIYRPRMETFPLKYCPHRTILGFEGLRGLCHSFNSDLCSAKIARTLLTNALCPKKTFFTKTTRGLDLTQRLPLANLYGKEHH